MKKRLIDIPKNISVIYYSKKKIFVISRFLVKKLLKLKVQLFLIKMHRVINISLVLFKNLKVKKILKLKYLRNTTIALIKQMIIEIEILFYNQLKCIGIGYKVSNVEINNNKLLLFQIGYSHFLYFKIVEKNINFFCFKTTELFIIGNSCWKITQIAFLIRSFKKPEPYKGKGIIHVNEHIVLKTGKKI